jgi:SAM-dependent methyltransferase
MTADADIAEHYASGSLLDAIRDGLARGGTAAEQATIDDLAPVDEFHIGGRPATRHLCEQIGISAGDHVLDIGCGIGGTARFLASAFGCSVTGIDLTPAYIEVARELSTWTGLAEDTDFVVGSALDTGAEEATFDRAVQVHVGMNISDKHALFAEAHRVLRPGGEFAVYDIMRTSSDDVSFPVPWASDASMSHIEPADTYRSALDAAGLDVVVVDDRGDFARDFFARLAATNTGEPPPLGLHVIMGADAPTKISNMVAAVMTGTLAPTEIIARKPS